MSEEQQPTTAVAVADPVKPPIPVSKATGNIEVSAESPPDMEAAQGLLVEWARNKVESVKQEHAECEAAYLHAKKCKWKSDVLRRQTEKAAKRLEFYEKILAALQAGYVIVPPFPIDVFAIRTGTKKPTRILIRRRDESRPTLGQSAQRLPVGEGEYQNPYPVVDWRHAEDRKDAQGNVVTMRKYYVDSWAELEFPLSMSKFHIMQATNRAMAMRIFDEFGIFERGSDPMILGNIIKPGQWRERISFMIAWSLDTRTL